VLALGTGWNLPIGKCLQAQASAPAPRLSPPFRKPAPHPHFCHRHVILVHVIAVAVSGVAQPLVLRPALVKLAVPAAGSRCMCMRRCVSLHSQLSSASKVEALP